MRETLRRYWDDWTILKYGWLAVFIIHIAFLGIGVFWLKQAWRMEHPDLYTIPELRVSYALTAAYMITISFSIILLIITVFVFDLFRTVRRLSRDLEDMRLDRERSAPSLRPPVDEDTSASPSRAS